MIRLPTVSQEITVLRAKINIKGAVHDRNNHDSYLQSWLVHKEKANILVVFKIAYICAGVCATLQESKV
jgi:hypothetical protein